MYCPDLAAALECCLDQYPAHLVVDLTGMIFCSVRGLELLTQAGCSAAEKAASCAVSGAPPSAERVWTLCWGDEFPDSLPQHHDGRDRHPGCRVTPSTTDFPTGSAGWKAGFSRAYVRMPAPSRARSWAPSPRQ